MLEMMIGLYAIAVWLIFKKFKLLPWNFKTQVVVYSIPIFGSIALILALNYYCPITSDVRVINRSLDVSPQILGRVNKVYIVSNQEVQKGDTLFTLDPEPYLLEIKSLEATLANTQAVVRSGFSEIQAAQENIAALQSQLALANKRVGQFDELVKAGAGNKFDLDQAQANVQELESRVRASRSQLQALLTKVNASYDGENASISDLRTKLDQAKWKLEQTIITAEADGVVPNVQINVGAVLSAFKPAFVLIQKQQSITGLFAQNELETVEPGNEVELALRTEPGKIVKAQLDYVIDATSQGILNNATGMIGGNASSLPNTATAHPELEGKLIARFTMAEGQQPLTTGARGTAVIYSDHLKALHLIRKVMIRVNSKLNYFIPKLH